MFCIVANIRRSTHSVRRSKDWDNSEFQRVSSRTSAGIGWKRTIRSNPYFFHFTYHPNDSWLSSDVFDFCALKAPWNCWKCSKWNMENNIVLLLVMPPDKNLVFHQISRLMHITHQPRKHTSQTIDGGVLAFQDDIGVGSYIVRNQTRSWVSWRLSTVNAEQMIWKWTIAVLLHFPVLSIS